MGVARHAPGERLAGVDRGDRDLEPAVGEFPGAEFAERGLAARLEHADGAPRALQHVGRTGSAKKRVAARSPPGEPRPADVMGSMVVNQLPVALDLCGEVRALC